MMNENLSLYERVRSVDEDAQKKIKGGRINGFTDINPMWRIKKLTEQFGACGFGWYYSITKQWTETFGSEVRAFVNIELFVKMDGEWSRPIVGTGGSSFVCMEARGVYVSDECYKMALTDAISVACKALGMGADVYWASDANSTKYAQKEYVQSGNAKPIEDPIKAVKEHIKTLNTTDELMAFWNANLAMFTQNQELASAMTARKHEIKNANIPTNVA